MDVITLPQTLTSCISLLLHGVISLPDAMSDDKIKKAIMLSLSDMVSFSDIIQANIIEGFNSTYMYRYLDDLLKSKSKKVSFRIRQSKKEGAKIRNRYNQAPHLTQDTNGKVTTSQLDITNESQEVSPFPAENFALLNWSPAGYQRKPIFDR